ncbi:MAG: tripartite tricarboxylate transporter permease [Acidobacteriota bacterium]
MNLDQILLPFFDLLNLHTVLYAAGAMFLGILFGAMPGLTAALGVALLTGMTFSVSTGETLVILLNIYVGAIYGGSLSAILTNIPGTGAAIATSWEGYPLAQQGQAGLAIGTAATASFIGTLIGLAALTLAAPLLSKIALKISSPEIALLALLGVLLVGSLQTPDTALKGWLAGFAGLLLSTVGLDDINSFPRFTFGSPHLLGGISFIPAMIGLFGIAQILDSLRGNIDPKPQRFTRVVPNLRTLLSYLPATFRSALVGVGIGVTPGIGENIASIVSYTISQKLSKEKGQYGRGSYEGIIAAETANNACVPAATVPLLTLGIPGSPVTAIMLGALLLHGVRPGPLLLAEQPRFLWDFVAIFLLAAVLLYGQALLLARPVSKILEIKPTFLLPIVSTLCVIGTYALNLSHFDVYLMVFFGLLGFVMRVTGYPAAPMVLGLILGPYLEINLRRTWLISEGSFAPFVTRPVSLLLLIVITWLVFRQAGLFRRN